jgi:hypothetical protein
MPKEGWGVLLGHQWVHDLAIRGELYMAAYNLADPSPELRSSCDRGPVQLNNSRDGEFRSTGQPFAPN